MEARTATATATETDAPTCQHCDHEVVWGKTEFGFAGFVHVSTNSTVCPR